MAEPAWEQVTLSAELGGGKAYSRPLLGSELLADQATRLCDGLAECCLGVTFKTTLGKQELLTKAKESLTRLRFTCPVMAASLHAGVHDPQLRSWVYVPAQKVDDARTWAEEILFFEEEAVDPQSFILSKNLIALPYTLPNDKPQFLRVYIAPVKGAENTYGFFFHGTHAFMDAKPTLNVFYLFFEYLTTPQTTSLGDLEWGTEFSKLPPGPFTATGGPRPEWPTAGMALVGKLMAAQQDAPTTPVLGAKPDISELGKIKRFSLQFSETETSSILKALKARGHTFTHLMEAAVALATFKLNPVPADQASTAHVSVNNIVALVGRMTPEYETRNRLVSSFVNLPIKFPWQVVAASDDDKERLAAALATSKALYGEYLSNPCTVQLMAQLMQLAPPRDAWPYKANPPTMVTNYGVIENNLPTTWPLAGGAPVVEVDQLQLGLRWTQAAPVFHGWTMHGKFTLLLQSPDNVEEPVLRQLFDEVVKYIKLVQ